MNIEFNKLLVRFVKSSLISCLTKPITELQNHLVSPLTRNQGHCNLICNWIQAKTLKSFGVTINTNGLLACNFYKNSWNNNLKVEGCLSFVYLNQDLNKFEEWKSLSVLSIPIKIYVCWMHVSIPQAFRWLSISSLMSKSLFM